ncbi:MAG: endosialidase [Lachnospiraceae bacterium]|nr:endosialidase [Lachnospiraceae bacterium]
MAIVEQLIRSENDAALSFGNYQLLEKAKVEDFPFSGSSYKVKTFQGITRLEKDGMFVYESVPGTSVNGFVANENGVEFLVSGKEDAQLTVGLSEDETYNVFVNNEKIGDMKTNMSGKLSISVELDEGCEIPVKITK